jgi:hypothetical protein
VTSNNQKIRETEIPCAAALTVTLAILNYGNNSTALVQNIIFLANLPRYKAFETAEANFFRLNKLSKSYLAT